MTNTSSDKPKKRLFGLGGDSSAKSAPPEDRVVAAETHPIQPTADGEKHDHLADKKDCAEDRQEALLDEAIEETFPGSDPISPKHIT